MTDCPKAECGAMIGEDGYCTRCGTAARSQAAPRAPRPPPAAVPQTATFPVRSSSSVSGRGSTGSGSRFGSRRAPLVSLPPVPADDNMVPVLDDPQVPEAKRFCPNPACRRPVGRARNGQAGRPEGFCTQCGTEFCFRPPLGPGSLVGDGQFEVKGAIEHGGLGWIYRAWDRRVKHWVVLKGLIDPEDPDKRQAAVAEVNIHVLAAGVLESRRVGEVGGWVVRDGGWYQVGAGVGGRQGSPVRALRMPARTSTPCLRMVSM